MPHSPRRRRPHRWAAPAICLLVGAMLTWATAWALVLLPHRLHFHGLFPGATAVRADLTPRSWTWRFHLQSGFGLERWESCCFGTPHPDISPPSNLPDFLAAATPAREEYLAKRHARPELNELDLHNHLRGELFFDELAGWPMRCLRHEVVAAFTPVGYIIQPDQKVRSGITLDSRAPLANNGTRRLPYDRLIALPCRPMWIGFMTNTAFFATLAWLAVFGPGIARRALRRRRGRCEACGYDRRGLGPDAACPECGVLALIIPR